MSRDEGDAELVSREGLMKDARNAPAADDLYGREATENVTEDVVGQIDQRDIHQNNLSASLIFVNIMFI